MVIVKADPGWAQGTVRVDLGGEVGVSWEASWYRFDPPSDLSRRTWREWLALQVGGFVVDPRLLMFDVKVQPLFAQSRFEPDSESGGADGFVGFFGIRALYGTALNVTLSGSRINDDVRGRFGSLTDQDFWEWRAEVAHKNPYLPATFTYDDRTRDVLWQRRPTSNTNRSNDRTRVLRLIAANSKINLRLERLTFDDRLSDRDFTRNQALLNHLFRWGKGSSVNSWFRYIDRSGTAPFELLAWNEMVHLQHRLDTYTDLEWRLGRQETAAGVMNDVFWRGVPAHDINRVLTVALEGFGEYRNSSVARQSYTRVRPEARVVAPLPLGLTFAARVAGGYEWHDQDSFEDGEIEIANEPHIVTPDGRFLLDEPFANPGSVMITSADGADLFQEGADYRLSQAGPFLEVFVLPGGRISLGQTLLVDYRVRVLPEASTNALLASWDVSLRLGGLVRIYHERALQDDLGEVPPGVIPALRNYDNTTTGLDVSVPLASFGSFSVQAAHERRKTDVFDFTNRFVRAAIGIRIGRSLDGQLRGLLSSRTGSGTPVDRLQGTGVIDWTATRTLTFRGYLTVWNWREPERKEDFLGGGLGIEWRLGLFTTLLRFDRASWEDGMSRVENRVYARVSRAF